MPLKHSRLRFLLLLLLVPALLPVPAASSDSPATSSGLRAAAGPDSPFGVAGAMRWPDWGTFDQPAEAVLDSGAAWVRLDFAWGNLEPQEGHFNWEGSDRIVRVLSERKISMLGIISYAVGWATPAGEDDGGGISFYQPDLNKYYNWVRTLADRYKGRVQAWEVWNEPNNGIFWKPQPDPRQYAEVLKTAYRAVKDADPNALVVSGGMSGNAAPFLEEVIAAGAAGSFDVLGLHPYAVPVDGSQARVESSPETHKLAEVEMPKYRALLERHGLGRPIWVTEIGWPAGDWQLDESWQADYLVRAYALLLGGGIAQKVFWYSFKDEGAGAHQSWGLLGWGGGNMDLGVRRASFGAYNALARLLAGARPLAPAPAGPHQVVADFEQPAEWRKTSGASGGLSIGGEQVRNGSLAAKLEYNFAARNQSVDLAPPEPIAIPGHPERIGAWIRGDSSGNYLSAWLRDAGGELFKLRFGSLDAASAGWRYYEAPLDGYFFPWERAPQSADSRTDGRVDYPLSLVALRVENTPDGPPGMGVIYVDDLQVAEGTAVTGASFALGDGGTVRLLWSANPTTVELEPGAIVLDRAGMPLATNGDKLSVGPSPVYVVKHGSAAPAASAGPQAAECLFVRPARQGGAVYFQETGHNLSGLFRDYWERNGGLRIFGFPLSEEFYGRADDGRQYLMQYFERARFELHPDNAATPVMPSLLGAAIADQRGFGRAEPIPGAGYAPETGHNVALLREWWERNGGIPVFGYPVSEELTEQNPADGNSYTVQYFERNRLEYHPEYAGTDFEVQLGLLGAERLRAMGCLP